RSLLIHCLKPAPTGLKPGNVLIVGGESLTGITALWIAPANALDPALATSAEINWFGALAHAERILVVRTSAAGDFAPYNLRLVDDAARAQADPFDVTQTLSGFDPQLAEVRFSFKVECGPDFDCKPRPGDCQPPALVPPPINYLARD